MGMIFDGKLHVCVIQAKAASRFACRRTPTPSAAPARTPHAVACEMNQVLGEPPAEHLVHFAGNSVRSPSWSRAGRWSAAASEARCRFGLNDANMQFSIENHTHASAKPLMNTPRASR